MKPFYGIDRTINKKSPYHEGDCFIAATISDLTRQSYARALKGADEQIDHLKLPLVLRWAKTGCGFVTAMIAIGTARSLDNVTLSEAYGNAPFLFWAGGICALVWLVLTLLGQRKVRAVAAEEGFIGSLHRLEGEVGRIRRELEVPENAKDVDVVQITHRWKDGKMKCHTGGMETTPYTNVSMPVFRRGNVLCFTDLEHRYEIPLEELRCLRRVKKPMIIQDWTKDEPINAEFYKPYKLSMDNYGRVHVKAYGLLELNHGGVEWAVWLPPYELNYISALTGLTVVEE